MTCAAFIEPQLELGKFLFLFIYFPTSVYPLLSGDVFIYYIFFGDTVLQCSGLYLPSVYFMYSLIVLYSKHHIVFL